MTDPGDVTGADRVRALVREEFTRRRSRCGDDARALETTAIELDLSLEDCAAAIGREDLLGKLGASWRIEFPEVGPPALRRP